MQYVKKFLAAVNL